MASSYMPWNDPWPQLDYSQTMDELIEHLNFLIRTRDPEILRFSTQQEMTEWANAQIPRFRYPRPLRYPEGI